VRREVLGVSRTLGAIDSVDAADMGAIRTLQEWGWQSRGPEIRVSPCPTPNCGGSVLSCWGEKSCILCARGAGKELREPVWNGMLGAAERDMPAPWKGHRRGRR
jgi:hypothetical protein